MSEMILGTETSNLKSVVFDHGVCAHADVMSKVHGRITSRPRTPELEEDESFQQFVVYITITDSTKEHWLYYSREKMAEAEERLMENLSIGFGGHLDAEKDGGSQGAAAIMKAAWRELSEEIPQLNLTAVRLSIKRWIRDTSNPVGRVHLGIYIECILPLDLMRGLGFPIMHVSDIDEYFNAFEMWSQIILRYEGIVL